MNYKPCSTKHRFIKRLRNSLRHGSNCIGKVIVVADVNDADHDLGYLLIGFESHFGHEINIYFKLCKHPEFRSHVVWTATVLRAGVRPVSNSWSLKESSQLVLVETAEGHTTDSLQKLLHEVHRIYELETRIASLKIE